MATSGQISKAIYDGAEYNGNLVFSWSIVSQDAATNSSVISWKLYRTAMPGPGNGANATWTIFLDGTMYQGSMGGNGTLLTFASGTHTVKHAANGTATIFVSFAATCGYWTSAYGAWGTMQVASSGTGTLDAIITPAKLTYASNFTNLTNPSISYSNPMGAGTTTLEVGIFSMSGSITYAGYRSLPKTGSSYTFTLSSSEIQALTNASSNGSLSVYFMIRSIINGKTYMSSMSATYSVKRAAYISAAPNFTDVENPTIKYYNQDNRSTNLRAAISLTGATDDIPYRVITPNSNSTYTFELTTAEREILINAVKTGNSCEVRFYLKSDFQGGTYTTSLTRTFSLTDYEPYMDPVVVDMNSITNALTGDINTLIQYRSTAACQFNAIAKKGATIKSYKIVNGSQTRDYDIAAIENVESGVFEFTVVDSRGNSSTQTITKPLIEYTMPTCQQEVSIELAGETQAKAKVVISGEWFNSTFGDGENAVHNALTVGYRYKVGSGEYGDWEEIEYLADDSDYKITATPTLADYTKTYTFQCRASDILGVGAITAEYKIKLVPVFDWSKEDFKFNVPVEIDGDLTVKGSLTIEGGGSGSGDSVIETGTEAMGSNGTWYWEKWASGKAVCWGVRNYGNMAINNPWGNGYYSEHFNQDLPGIFSEGPSFVSINVHGAESNYAWVARKGLATADATGEFAVVRFTSGNVSQVHIEFHAIGKWK